MSFYLGHKNDGSFVSVEIEGRPGKADAARCDCKYFTGPFYSYEDVDIFMKIAKMRTLGCTMTDRELKRSKVLLKTWIEDHIKKVGEKLSIGKIS